MARITRKYLIKAAPSLVFFLYKINDISYAEYSKVSGNRISTPVPLDDDTWDSIVQSYRTKRERNDVQKDIGNYFVGHDQLSRLLHLSFNEFRPEMCWYTRPMKKELKEYRGKQVTFSLPYMVFISNLHGLKVYVTMEKPTLKSKLYIVPFGNLQGDYICMGTAKKPETDRIDLYMQGWEDAYFKSEFTSLVNSVYYNDTKMLQAIQSGKIIKTRLVPAKVTLEKQLKHDFSTDYTKVSG